MKVRTVLISVVVTGALVAGGSYGAYHVISNNKSPVEVVPVTNVNQSYFSYYYGDTDSISGVVTSKVSQNIVLDESTDLDAIYVKVGDKVKEGTPLFSYDKTLTELELEMEKLTQQTNQLAMTKLEKDLEKYQKMHPVATVASQDAETTGSSPDDEMLGGDDQNNTGENGNSDGGNNQQTGGIVDIEPSDNPGLTDPEEGQSEIQQYYTAYLNKMTLLVQMYQSMTTSELESSMQGDYGPVGLFRNHLAAKKVTESGVIYEITDAVKEELGEASVNILSEYADQMRNMQAAYVVMLCRDALQITDEAEQLAAVQAAKAVYDELEYPQQVDVAGTDAYEAIKAILNDSETGGNETGGNETGGNETGGNETGGNESGGEETGGNETGGNETGGNESGGNETGGNESGGNETGGNESGGNETGGNETGGNETGGNESGGNETGGNESGGNETGGNESGGNESGGNESGGNQSGDHQPDGNLNDIQTNLQAFQQLYETAKNTGSLEDMDVAINFYQQKLAAIAETEIDGENDTMERFVLLDEVVHYLQSQGGQNAAELAGRYKALCLGYAKSAFAAIDKENIDTAVLENARKIYSQLGTGWRDQLEDDWHTEQENAGVAAGLTLNEMLGVYDALAAFQQYLNSGDEPSVEDLQAFLTLYDGLSEAQRQLLIENEVIAALLRENGREIPGDIEPETGNPGDGFGNLGDGFGNLGGEGYTAAELKEMIENTKRQIKSWSLEIRTQELVVAKKERELDAKTVKSKIDGIVVSVGGKDGSSDDEYFIKIASETGLYAKGTISELNLDQIHVGDVVYGSMTDSGIGFTAVVKEISEYPEQNNDNYYGYGMDSQNSNASYYPFMALIEDSEGLEEGEMQIQLSNSSIQNYGEEDIYLDDYYIRQDTDGSKYVYVRGEDGLLKKQRVTTGKSMYSVTQITSGISAFDEIAFPYGKNVKEGADTKEVDMLSW